MWYNECLDEKVYKEQEFFMSHEDVVLPISKRDVVGKAVRALRAQGQVPGVIYDHGTTTHVSVANVPFMKAYHSVGHSQPIELELDGKKHLAMIREVDMDPVKHGVRHMIFQAINKNETVEAEVTIEIRGEGETPAERAGLIVLKAMETIQIKALPKNLPENLQVDGAKLVEPGDRATLADVELPEGVEYADAELDMELVVANVYEPSAIAAANDAMAGDEDATAADVEAENGEDTPQGGADQAENPGGKKANVDQNS